MSKDDKLEYRLTGETIYSASNRALVGQETGDSSLVFWSSPSDESRVVDETVLLSALNCSELCLTYFWSISLCLEGSEESLFSTENLDSRSGVFGQIGQ